MSQTSATLRKIEGGPLVGVHIDNSVWTFEFANKLRVKSFSGWRLFDAAMDPKTVLGSRDLEASANPAELLICELSGFSLTVLHFNSMRDWFELILHSEDLEQRSITLFKTSAEMENWQIIGEDFIDSDKKNIIKNLSKKHN